jgi:hypothetical protein
LIASTGVLLNASNEITELTLYQTETTDTSATGAITKITPLDLSFQHYILRVTQDGNDDYDGGAKFDYVRMKLYQK